MARKYDAVVEAVRYTPGNRVELVRVYERRGSIFSDCVLLTRQQMVERMNAGKVFVAGQRRPTLGNTFELGRQLSLAGAKGSEVLTTALNPSGDGDDLRGVPVF